MQVSRIWLSALAREDDLLVGQWQTTFGGQSVAITVSFVTPGDEPSARQVSTFATYLQRQEELHADALAAIFERYQMTVERYRAAFREWGEDADALAPMIKSANDLLPLLELQTVFVPADGDGVFGLGFWSRWEQEHGVGVRFSNWEVAEAGDGEVHFLFDEAAN